MIIAKFRANPISGAMHAPLDVDMARMFTENP